MKKLLTSVLALAATAGFAFSQESVGTPDPTVIGNDSARQALKEVSVDRFELEGAWKASISPDNGVIGLRLFDGSPAAKEPIQGDENVTDVKVLGVKAEFFHRGVNSFYIRSARPIPIEGVTKTISLWVSGRNKDHSLFVLVQDYYGNNFELFVGTLGFSGWKKMQVAVPPTPDGEHGIIQQSAYDGERPGLRIVGFRVDCNPVLARGTYYIYMDDLRAVTDLYDVENRDEDDMRDDW